MQHHTVCVCLCATSHCVCNVTLCVCFCVTSHCVCVCLCGGFACHMPCASSCVSQHASIDRCVCYVVVKGIMCRFVFLPLQLTFLNSQSVPFVFIFNLPTWSHANSRRQSVISPSLLLALCCMAPYFIFNDFIKALF